MRRARDLCELILCPETNLKSSTYAIKFDIEVTEEETYNRMPSGCNANFCQILESVSQDIPLLLILDRPVSKTSNIAPEVQQLCLLRCH